VPNLLKMLAIRIEEGSVHLLQAPAAELQWELRKADSLVHR